LKLRTLAVVVLLLLPAMLFAQDKKRKKPSVPAVFGTAQYAWVESQFGDASTPGQMDSDRQAIFDVQNALRNWNRYRLTTRRDQAELVFVVRKGRLASATVGVGTGIGPTASSGGASDPFGRAHSPGAGVSVGGDVGPEDDILEVRTVLPDGRLSAPIWTRSLSDGLEGPHVMLVQLLKSAVEKEYPKQ
jgi:hypothetical protein